MSEFKDLPGSIISPLPTTVSVVGFLLKDNKILLGERLSSSTNLGLGLYAGIGGKVGDLPENVNESCNQALIREFGEEAGIVPTVFKQVGRVVFLFKNKPFASKWNQVVFVYVVTEYRGTIRTTQSTNPVWFDTDKIPYQNMWADNKYWLPFVLEGQNFLAEFIYKDAEKVREMWIRIL